ncbi:MAG: DUF6497 family protein [Rhodobacterales bacterium]|nr:DUF6497 family protein [Rhodobacterales bacterium]
MTLPQARVLFVLGASALLAACQEEAPVAGSIDVPSGREVTLIDVITNIPGNAGAAARFRFLAPGLVSDDTDAAVADMQALCDGYALPRTEGTVPKPSEIIISLSAEVVPFGQPSPEVVQFFETYRVEDGACIWEPF